jgi:hypothetical protein
VRAVVLGPEGDPQVAEVSEPDEPGEPVRILAGRGPAPDGHVDAAVIAGRGGVETAVDAVRPGGTVLVFADSAAIPAARVYRDDHGRRRPLRGTPADRGSRRMLGRIQLPEPTVLLSGSA